MNDTTEIELITLKVTITKTEHPPENHNPESKRIIATTSEGLKIAFWGNVNRNYKNMKTVSEHPKPFDIECEARKTTKKEKNDYDTDYSVNENSPILIRPTP